MGHSLVLVLVNMNLCILLSLSTLSLAWGLPARMEQEAMPQEVMPEIQEAIPNADSMSNLAEISDMGSQHAEEGARKARFLWGGIWSGPYWPRSYYYSYYRPWGYRYWW